MNRGTLGLCMAAGGVKTGTDTVLGEIRSRSAKFVMTASDASERTLKQIRDKCRTYGIDCYEAPLSGTELADALGKRSTCVAVSFNGRGPWRNVLSELTQNTDTSGSDRNGKDN